MTSAVRPAAPCNALQQKQPIQEKHACNLIRLRRPLQPVADDLGGS
jgi:hypothetical protein|tara:strand:- start:13 stop:150 length:138 start_codon:yes stop_codon:yes gene_type:complete